MEQTGSEGKASTPRKKTGKVIGIILIVAAVLLGAAVFILARNRHLTEQERQNIINSGVFHDGITVNGVSVGGMTVEEAKAALADTENVLLEDIRYTLTLDGTEKAVLTKDDFAVSFNTDEVLGEAMLLAREGTLTELQEELKDISENGRSYEITYTLDAAPVKEKLASLAEEINCEPTDAEFIMNPASVGDATLKDGGTKSYTFSDGTSEVSAAIDGGTATETMTEATTETTAEASSDRFLFREGTDGITVDTDALYETIASMASEKSYGTVEIPYETTEGEVTVESLKANLVLRGSYYTSFASGHYARDTRVHNIKKAAALVNGTILAPDEVFSTNDTLGNRTYAAGWQPAPAVIDGGADSEDQAGGGVCQVSSTLYNAVLLSDLQVVYRQAHSAKLSYVPGGLDATIDSGHIDFKWKNDTTSNVYVFCWVDSSDKTVHVEIYGEPFPDTFDTVKIYSKQLEKLTPGEDVYTLDTSLPAGTVQLKTAKKNGSVWESYREYYKDGVQVGETEVIAKTTYKAHPNRYIYGTGYVPGSTETPTASPSPTPTPTNSFDFGGFSFGG